VQSKLALISIGPLQIFSVVADVFRCLQMFAVQMFADVFCCCSKMTELEDHSGLSLCFNCDLGEKGWYS